MPHAEEPPRRVLTNLSNGTVADIGGSRIGSQNLRHLNNSFVAAKCRGVRPSLPEELLYDDTGLRLWADLIYHSEYYQTRDEIKLIDANALEIAHYIRDGTSFIDLGAGDTQKVMHLLDVLERLESSSIYFALDISHESLVKNIARIAGHYSHVQAVGLWGTFKNFKEYCSQITGPRVFLSLGSVLFNDPPHRAVNNLRIWAESMRADDFILAGMDGHSMPQDKDKIWSSYHGKGSKGLWDRFWSNGFARANKVIGENYFKLEDWEVLGEVLDNPVSHQFIFRARRDVSMDKLGIKFKKGEEWDWFDAHKNGPAEVRSMCREVGLEVVKIWQIEGSKMYQYLIRRQKCPHPALADA